MGFALTILYVVVTIISPEQFGKEWATYHVLTYLAVLTALFSVPNLAAFRYWKSIQTFLLLGLVIAIAMSQVAAGWLGGVLDSWRTFLPSAATFFFIVVNVTTVRRLKVLTLASVATCLVVAVEALCGYYAGFKGDLFILQNNLYSSQDDVIGLLTRVRGAGFLSDPNDLAQILLICLPLSFIAWRRRHMVANFFFVLVPSAVILWTTYLTHSRGGLIALAAVALLAARKKLGTTPSVILAAIFVLGLLALDFTGGRGISATDGADRLEAWANGLEMFKRSPLFGIGFGNFTDYHEITAHNSFVLCLAELGLLGSVLWMGLLVTTITRLNRLIGGKRKRPIRFFGLQRLFETSYIFNAPALAGEPALHGNTIVLKDAYASQSLQAETSGVTKESDPQSQVNTDEPAPPELQIVPKQWLTALRLGMVAFMAAAWFLSRSYTTTMYLLLGLATAAIALQQGERKSESDHWIFFTGALEVSMIALIYCLVRLRH